MVSSSHLVTDNTRMNVLCEIWVLCSFLTFSFFYLMQIFHQHISFVVRSFHYILILSSTLVHFSPSKHTIASDTEKRLISYVSLLVAFAKFYNIYFLPNVGRRILRISSLTSFSILQG